MIPDQPPSQEVLESALRHFAELAESSTLNPKEIYPACLMIANSMIYEHENKENLEKSPPAFVDGNIGMHEEGKFCDEMSRSPDNPFIESDQPTSENEKCQSKNVDDRPDLSYIELIKMALLEANNHHMKLVDIYAWIENEYPFFAKCGLSWKVLSRSYLIDRLFYAKNSVRHALSISKYFNRVIEKPEWCRGGEWTLNREMLTEEELKRVKMTQEPSPLFTVIDLNTSRKKRRSPRPPSRKSATNNIKEMICNSVNEPECLSQYPSICFGDANNDISDLLGEHAAKFTGIFSGTQTPLDPFCSIEESEKDFEMMRKVLFDDCDDYHEGNIFDLIIAEDGMIRNRPHKRARL